jgi:cytochrome P450
MGLLTVLLFTAPLVLILAYLLKRKQSNAYRQYTGLHGLSGKLLSAIYTMKMGVWDFVLWLYETYRTPGYTPIHFTTMMGNPALFVYHPDHVNRITTDINHFEWTSEKETVEYVSRLLPDGVVTKWKYEDWHPIRSRIVYYLSGRSLERIKKFSTNCSSQYFLPEIKKVANGQPVDLAPIIFRYALLSTLMEMFDLRRDQISEKTLDHVTKLFSYIWKRIFNPLIIVKMNLDRQFPWLGLEKEYKEDFKALYDLLEPHIERLRYVDTLGGATVRGRTDFKPNFVKAAQFVNSILNSSDDEVESKLREYYQEIKDEKDDVHRVSVYLANKLKLPDDQVATFAGHLCEGCPVNIERVVNETLTLMLGGAETNAIYFQWVLLHMAENPHIQEKVYEELKDKELVPIPQRTSYINNIVQEVLRLSGPTYYSQRGCHTETILNPGNFLIPAGTIMVFSQLLQSTLEENFEDALTFNPDRWSEEIKLKHGTYLPFIKGRRTCPGAEVAQTEGAIFITTIFQNFKIQRADNTKIGKLCGLTVMPNPPIMLRITPIQKV